MDQKQLINRKQVILKHKKVKIEEKRWLILILASIMSLGNYYCMDLPQSLQTFMIEGPLALSYKDYNLMFSIYSLPNVVMVILAGIFVDKIGVRLVLFFFVTMLCMAQMVVVLGFYFNHFWLVLLGRFVNIYIYIIKNIFIYN